MRLRVARNWRGVLKKTYPAVEPKALATAILCLSFQLGSAYTNALRGCIVAKHNSHEGNDAFWERRAEGRQDRAHRVLRNPDLAPDPFDAVDEILTGSIDKACGNQQEACGYQYG